MLLFNNDNERKQHIANILTADAVGMEIEFDGTLDNGCSVLQHHVDLYGLISEPERYRVKLYTTEEGTCC